MKMFGRHRVVVGLVNRTVRVLYRSINRIKLQRFIADIYQIYKVKVYNENKSQTSANKYTNIQCIIYDLIFSVVFILFS